MRKVFFLLLFVPTLLSAQITVDKKSSKNAFMLADTKNIASVYYETSDDEVVKKAANLFAGDIKMVTGKNPTVFTSKKNLHGNLIIIGTVGKNSLIDALVAAKKIDVADIKNQWERYIIKTIQNPFPGVKQALVIAGSDRRGTAFGVFTLSESMGVSPWYWWADVPVQKNNSLYVTTDSYLSKAPSVKYRGIFINDEDWGMHPWAARKMDPSLHDIGPHTYARVCELLLRLKANTLWPAMHEVTGAFNKYTDNKLVADSFGIVMGSSHCEPLLFNNASEWNKKNMGEWNYSTNKSGILEQLDKRVQSNAPYENVYTVALRGLHDGGMIGNLTMQEKVENLQNAVLDQRQILGKYITKPVETIPQIFVPYKEVMDLYNKGAKIPDDVTIVWPDDNYGYIKRLSTPEEQNRSGRSGVYYHVSYLGEPHNYLWMSTVSPALMVEEMSKAYHTGADRFWIVNVGDIKACEYSTTLFLKMAWDMNTCNYQDVHHDQAQWTAAIFGKKYTADFNEIWDKFYSLAFTRKPEYMGWGYEWNGPKEIIADTDFSFTHFGEAENRLKNYQAIANKATQILAEVPEEQKPAFFQLVYYPVKAACLMNQKMLIAQKNHQYYNEGRSKTNSLKTATKIYFDSLQVITDQYNALLQGKWQGMMSLKQGWLSSVHEMPHVDSLILPEKAVLAIFPEANDINKFDGNASKSLPVFNSFAPKRYYLDVVNKGAKPLEWKATCTEKWIKLSDNSGITSDEQRIFATIDWDKTPTGEKTSGEIIFSSGNLQEKVSVVTYNPSTSQREAFKGLFTEQNGTIVIPAADFHRKTDDGDVQVQVIEGLGIENKSIQFGDPAKRNLDPRASFKTSTEYDFYTFSAGWITIYTYALPVFPLNPLEKANYGLRIDDGIFYKLNIEAGEYTDEWKENVLKNFTVNKSRYFLPTAGKHTLKISCQAQGIVIQKIIIDTGGLKSSYLGPSSSKVE